MPSLFPSGRVRRVVCLVTDRLSAGMLGSYGNTWVATPHFDQLASESFLFDQAIVDGPTLDQFTRAVWLGTDATPDADHVADTPTLAQALAELNVATTLLTDAPIVRDHPLGEAFGRCIVVPCHQDASEATSVAPTIDDTHCAQFFATAADCLSDPESHGLVWLHTQGMAGPWDAPLAYRDAYASEDDPEPPRGADVPCRMLPPDVDPDERLGMNQAYAGQVTLWDTCLGALLEEMASCGVLEESLFVVLSARGFPLGEHQAVGAPGGDQDAALYGELIHIPWLVRFPEGSFAAQRSLALVQPSDLYGLILDCLRPEGLTGRAEAGLLDVIEGQHETLRDRLLVAGPQGQRAIRTPEWYLRIASPEHDLNAPSSPQAELYVKPDDRWEVNDVADRCHDVVTQLTGMLGGDR